MGDNKRIVLFSYFSLLSSIPVFLLVMFGSSSPVTKGNNYPGFSSPGLIKTMLPFTATKCSVAVIVMIISKRYEAIT